MNHQSVIGRIRFMRSERESKCVCCPDSPTHIFARTIDFEPYECDLPEHFGRSANEFVYQAVLRDNGNEGKRIRLTVEILED
jgi:hypothetical protein